MRFNNYLTEDIVSKALSIPEPKVGQKYPPEKAKRYVEIIDKALASMRDREESDTNDAIVEDLRDKKQKWSNVKKATKPTITKKEEPIEPPPEQEPPPEEEPPPEKQPPVKENTNKIIFESFRLGNKNSKSFKIVSDILSWPDWYYTDMSQANLIKEIMKKFKLNNKKAKAVLDQWRDFRDAKINMSEFQDFVHMELQN
jgi:hypothetical protein